MRSHGPSDVSNGAATTEADLVSDGAASVRSRYSRHVRYASNTDRIDASQQNVAMCQLRPNALQQRLRVRDGSQLCLVTSTGYWG